MKSTIQTIGPVAFPAFQSERVYMLPFTPADGLPSHLARWRPTVEAMLVGIEVPGEVYLMIDQADVFAGKTHRRGGPHIDGNWFPGVKAHGGGHGLPAPGHRPGHRSGGMLSGRWGGGDGGMGDSGWGQGGSGDAMGSHGHSGRVRGGIWVAENFTPELLVLASDVSACVAWEGEVDGDPLAGGDCSHLDLDEMTKVRLLAGVAYAGNVTMIHESVPVDKDCRRTLVRLNVPGGVLCAA